MKTLLLTTALVLTIGVSSAHAQSYHATPDGVGGFDVFPQTEAMSRAGLNAARYGFCLQLAHGHDYMGKHEFWANIRQAERKDIENNKQLGLNGPEYTFIYLRDCKQAIRDYYKDKQDVARGQAELDKAKEGDAIEGRN